jgi:hypothetical protein
MSKSDGKQMNKCFFELRQDSLILISSRNSIHIGIKIKENET